jgi:hypothetical protein
VHVLEVKAMKHDDGIGGCIGDGLGRRVRVEEAAQQAHSFVAASPRLKPPRILLENQRSRDENQHDAAIKVDRFM